MPSRSPAISRSSTALRRPTNLTSLDIDKMPHGLKSRMLELISHKNLFRLRRRSHSLKRLIDRRGYFARNLVIVGASHRNNFIKRAKRENHSRLRFLTPEEAAALRRPIYVENCLNFKYSNANEWVNKTMLKNIVPCYTTLMVTEGLRVTPMISLIHSKLLICAIADRALNFIDKTWNLFLNTLSPLSQKETFSMFTMLRGVVPDDKLKKLNYIFNQKPENIRLHQGDKAVVYGKTQLPDATMFYPAVFDTAPPHDY
uniref:F-box domain-containing protein n=1 Tax=Panagrellus redivivus TaxID=6233 RepID=A0A7E4VFL7_PANRE